jgi:hypothetical protein
MGLISDGQVHSSLTHLYALLAMAKEHGSIASLFIAFWTVETRLRHPESITSRRFREKSRRLVAVRSLPSLVVTTQWIAISAGRERTGLSSY